MPSELTSFSRTLRQKLISLFRRFRLWFKSNHDMIKNCVEVVALLAAGGWALYQFVYLEKIKPSHEPPEITIITTLEDAGRQGNIMALSATVTIKNNSKVKINIASAYYNVSGYKMSALNGDQTDLGAYSKRIVASDPVANEFETPRYFKAENESEETIIQSGRILRETWLQPDEEETCNIMVYLPADKFDLIKCVFAANVARDIQFIQTEWPVENGKLKGRIIILPEDKTSGKAIHFRDLQGDERDKIVNKYGIAKKESKAYLSLWHGKELPPLSVEAKPAEQSVKK